MHESQNPSRQAIKAEANLRERNLSGFASNLGLAQRCFVDRTAACRLELELGRNLGIFAQERREDSCLNQFARQQVGENNALALNAHESV